jgi:hypothetical protein
LFLTTLRNPRNPWLLLPLASLQACFGL